LRHYLDHASTSPTRPEAREAMAPWFDAAADPGRVHTEGHAARVAIEIARDQVAALLGCRGSREVVFTSGATESIVTATWMATERGPHVVLPVVEHSAVRHASHAFATSVTEVAVDGQGRVSVDDVLDTIGDDTALVHVQLGNHEVGTMQPVDEIIAGCRERGVLVHVDAAMAAGHVPISFASLDADLLSVSSHKLGGPPGVGALLVRRGLRLRPLMVGGDQERSRRAGFENVPAIVGFGAACDAAAAIDDRERALMRRVVDGIGLEVLGSPDLPHLACFAIEGVEAEPVLLGLDQAGVAVHSGSSCSSEALEPSPVLEAMGVDASRSLRVSVGWSSTDADVDALLGALPGVLERLRALRT
jgi:cysteine desulfurase